MFVYITCMIKAQINIGQRVRLEHHEQPMDVNQRFLLKKIVNYNKLSLRNTKHKKASKARH